MIKPQAQLNLDILIFDFYKLKSKGFVVNMPRIRTLSNLINNIGKKEILRRSLRADPTHISMFCSEQQGQNLLEALLDVKAVKNLNQTPKLKQKLMKLHLKLEASAKYAQKLSLSSNQIRSQQKCFVINKKLMIESQSKSTQAQPILNQLHNYHKSNNKQLVFQQLNQCIQKVKLKEFICDEKFNGKWILNQSQSSSQILSQNYDLLINPTIIFGSQIQTKHEQCISFPFLDFMIPRYKKLFIHYYDQDYKSQIAYTNGFLSKIIQHQVEHLEGKIVLDWRINHGNISLNSSVLKYFPKSAIVIQDYANYLKDIFKQFPQLIDLSENYCLQSKKLQRITKEILNIRSNKYQQGFEVNQSEKHSRGNYLEKNAMKRIQQNDNLNSDFSINKNHSQDLISFEDDFLTRIVKHFKKEFIKFDEKVQMGLINLDQLNRNKEIQVQTKGSKPALIYNQQQYGKSIKIKYLNRKQDFIDQKNAKDLQQQPVNSLEQLFDQDLELSEEKMEKVIEKQKKSKKKKK